MKYKNQFPQNWNISGTILYLTAIFCFSTNLYSQSSTGTIKGLVTDEAGFPLMAVNLVFDNTDIGSATDLQGNYVISNIPPGKYTLLCMSLGYERLEMPDIVIQSGKTITRNIELKAEPLALSEVTVTPGRFAIMETTPAVTQTLSRREIETIPQFGEDIYRAMNRLPGVSPSNDFSAKFTVRGGEQNEVLVLLDGMELYDPFHMKDINGGTLSIIDVVAVEGIDLMTGGYTAEYGDRLSGVFNIKTKQSKPDQQTYSLGLSMMNTRLTSEGTFQENRGSWLISARRGYLDLIMDVIDEDIGFLPTYYDMLGKFSWRLNDQHQLLMNALISYDKLDFVEDDDDIVKTNYGNQYFGLTLNSTLSPRLALQSMVSLGNVTGERYGLGYHGNSNREEFLITDDRNFKSTGIKQLADFEMTDNWLVKFGYQFRRFTSEYDYASTKNHWSWNPETEWIVSETDEITADIEPEGDQLAVHFSNRYRITSKLTGEAGLRFDSNSFTDDELISPRLNFVYQLAARTFLRGGWGHYYQTQRIDEINVNDGVTNFNPAELAIHNVLGFEHFFRNGIHFRLEGYYKDLSDIWPRYQLWNSPVEIFPEVQDGRVLVNLDGATSKGLEFYLKQDTGGKFSWWVSYALAEVLEDISSVVSDDIEYNLNDEYPGRNDQRHTFYCDINYRPNPKWHFTFSWQYRSGLPHTPEIPVTEEGETPYWTSGPEYYNTGNFPDYHSLDIRFNRLFKTSKGNLNVFIEIINLYNRENIFAYNYWSEYNNSGEIYLVREFEKSFPMMPSIGMSWDFVR